MDELKKTRHILFHFRIYTYFTHSLVISGTRWLISDFWGVGIGAFLVKVAGYVNFRPNFPFTIWSRRQKHEYNHNKIIYQIIIFLIWQVGDTIID